MQDSTSSDLILVILLLITVAFSSKVPPVERQSPRAMNTSCRCMGSGTHVEPRSDQKTGVLVKLVISCREFLLVVAPALMACRISNAKPFCKCNPR